MKTLTFIPEQNHHRVLETGDLCSLPSKGIPVTIDNYSAGIRHSAHPNIHSSGSVEGMIALGYWRKTDKTLRRKGAIYNMSEIATSNLLDELCLAIERGSYTWKYEYGKTIFNF